MEWGARKDAASAGTLVAPRGVLDMAATRAGNLAWATPTLGARSWGAELSREFTSLASPPYMSSRPSRPNVGYTQVGPLHAVADPLHGGEHLVEHFPVGLIVRFQDHGVRLAGQGLLQGHSRSNAPARGKMVYYDRPWPGAVHDDGWAVLQVGMASHLHLGPQVSDENTGYLQDSSRDALLGWCGSAS